MPVYVYRCRDCGHKFELLRKNDDRDKDVECPRCGVKDPVRLVSMFSSSGAKGYGGYTRRFG